MYINIFTKMNDKEVYEEFREIFFNKIKKINDFDRVPILKQQFCEDVYLRIIFMIGVEIFSCSNIKEIKDSLNLQGYPELFTEEFIKVFIDTHTEEIKIVKELLNKITNREYNQENTFEKQLECIFYL